MSLISENYKQAEFAFAAYSNLTAGMSGKDYTDALQDSGKGMSELQAKAFAATYSVVDQFNDPRTKRGHIYFTILFQLQNCPFGDCLICSGNREFQNSGRIFRNKGVILPVVLWQQANLFESLTIKTWVKSAI